MLKFESYCRILLFSVVFLFCALCSNADSESYNKNLETTAVKLEQFKSDVFSTEKRNAFFAPNELECLKKLSSIGSGLVDGEEWAQKVVDAWGKIPSAIFEGNLHELGGFKECLNGTSSDKLFESKYCLGAIEIDLKKKNKTKTTHHYDIFNTGLLPNIWLRNEDDSSITPFAMTPPNPNAKPQLKFGMCVPAVCSVDFLQKLVNFTGKFKLSENTCQTINTGSELKALDIVVIIILSVVFLLALLSTGYDIYCTLLSYEKSQAFLAFSILSNGQKVLSYKKSKSSETMTCLHGIRAISTQWVVIGHTYSLYAMVPLRNMVVLPEFFSKWSNMMILSAPISVDTFFVLSGLLVSMNMLKHLKKSDGKINIPMLYFHRYLRLTPLLIATLLVSITLLRFLGNGPLWPTLMDQIRNQCERYWWSSLLYVQNYVNPEIQDMCLTHTWYLSVDMQLFLVAPFIVYLIYWFDLKAILFFILPILGCMGWTVVVNVNNELKTILSPNKFPLVYVPTHLRFSSWLVGVMAGYIFLKYQNRSIRIPRLFNVFAWALSLAIMLTVIFANTPLMRMDTKATSLEFGLYDALTRVFWSIALCYIIFACVHNAGGPVNWFLSHPLWQPIARLSYATYLVHFPVIIVVMVSAKTSVYFSEFSAFHNFIGIYILSLCVALIASLLFESPIVILEKLLFGSKKNSNSENKTVIAETYKKRNSES